MKATRRILLSLFACSASLAYAQQPVVGLITKTETNPFFVKMKEGAQDEAKAKGAKLMAVQVFSLIEDATSCGGAAPCAGCES